MKLKVINESRKDFVPFSIEITFETEGDVCNFLNNSPNLDKFFPELIEGKNIYEYLDSKRF